MAPHSAPLFLFVTVDFFPEKSLFFFSFGGGEGGGSE